MPCNHGDCVGSGLLFLFRVKLETDNIVLEIILVAETEYGYGVIKLLLNVFPDISTFFDI